MSHVDPDAFHGAVDSLISRVTDKDNAAALTAKGVDPVKIAASLDVIRDDVAAKKDVRDTIEGAIDHGAAGLCHQRRHQLHRIQQPDRHRVRRSGQRHR